MIIYPERDMGKRVGHNLAYSNIFDYIELNDDLSLMEINVGTNIVGKSLVEIDVRRKYGVNVVGIKHKDGSIEINMDPNEPLGGEDILVVVGTKDSVLKLESGL
jgi:trk system potassium uptake protein TrkA